MQADSAIIFAESPIGYRLTT